VRLDAASLTIEESLPLDDFAPATPAIHGEHIVVGSLVRGAIATRAGTELRIESLGSEATDSLFEATLLPGGLALVTQFNTDELHVFDLDGDELHPWPFTAPLKVGPGGPGKRGAQLVTAAGLDAVVVLGLSAELVPLSLRQVFGP
jgi:hypothetical protein